MSGGGIISKWFCKGAVYTVRTRQEGARGIRASSYTIVYIRKKPLNIVSKNTSMVVVVVVVVLTACLLSSQLLELKWYIKSAAAER